MGRAVSLGIDLGTTETVAYAINGEKTVPVKLSSSKHSLPSVVCRTLEGEWLVGEPALSHKRVHPDRVLLYKTKRLIGKTYGEAVSEGILRGLHYEVTEGTGPNEGKPVFNIDDEEVTPERVAAIILGEVVSKAKPVLEDMGGTLGRALVTIPAYFSNIQLKCMKHVLGMVGTSGLKSYARGFAREPSAAAYAYMYDVTDPHLLRWILVFDFGGGTVDVSVVSQELENRLEVKGQFGNLVTGGEDLDDIIVALVMREWREKNPDAAEPAPARMQKLKAECKRAKEELQQGPSSVRVEIEEFSKTSGGDHVHLTVDITKNEVDRAIDSTLNECLSVVEEALKVAKSTTKDAFSEAMLDKVIMVGGSSKLTLMQEKLKARFGDKVKLLNDPDVAVALGAAKLAWLDEQSEGKGEETEGARVITMQDSVPIGLGIEAVNGNHQKHLSIIFPAGTLFGETKSQTYTTVTNNQKEIAVRVLQGTRTDPLGFDTNKKLEEKTIKVLPRPKGQSSVVVKMRVDTDGCLNVEVVDDARLGVTKFSVEQRDMYRGADDWEELKKKAREDEIRQEEMKALNADYMRILAYAKTFGEDVSLLKERGECDADEVAEWEGMLEEVKEMRKCPTSELDGMEVGALLSRLGPADRAVREKADPLRAKVKAEEAEQRKRKREEEEIKEGGEDEEEDDEDFEVEDED